MVHVTPRAFAKVQSLLQREGRPDLRLRIAVQPGGCVGLQYELYFDERLLDGDQIQHFPQQSGEMSESLLDAQQAAGCLPSDDARSSLNGFALVLDRVTVPEVRGSTLDFVDTLQKTGFVIDNPRAKQSCACGDSFC
ncbi:iron-sulfur cluster assembly accessory protein [Kineosporia sp. NBRC 101677]|uniref:HesB/IscA family protein n=1 Tax=Kineosporia sp. NBRC 101677 TaxID=3032197 RepID=UPI003319C62F